MKKWLLIPILLMLLLPAAATGGPIDPNPDGIGIYADIEGRHNTVSVEAGEPMEVYVLVTRASGGGPAESGFSGVEFTIVMPDNVMLWGWNMPLAGSFAFTDPPDFMICNYPAVPYTEVIHALTLIIVPTDNHPARFFLTALQLPAGGDAPRYSDSDGFLLYDLTPYPGGSDNMCFVINGEIVPEEVASWSDLKALYR